MDDGVDDGAKRRNGKPRRWTRWAWVCSLLLIVQAGLLAVAISLGCCRGCDYPDYRSLTKAQVVALGAKVAAFRDDNGRMPATLRDLLRADGQGPYAREAELVDAWGRSFYYRVAGNGPDYLIFSLGSDGRLGGEGAASDQQYVSSRPEP